MAASSGANASDARVMTIRTASFGELQVPEEKIVGFREGIPGFPRVHEFAILEREGIEPFQYLQALGDPPVALLIVSPFLFFPDYKFELSASDMEDIQAANTADLDVFVVATVPQNPAEATINLLAPIVINSARRCGKQVVLLEGGYSVRHPLLSLGGSDPRPT